MRKPMVEPSRTGKTRSSGRKSRSEQSGRILRTGAQGRESGIHRLLHLNIEGAVGVLKMCGRLDVCRSGFSRPVSAAAAR